MDHPRRCRKTEEIGLNTKIASDHEERIVKLEKFKTDILRVIHLMIEMDKLEALCLRSPNPPEILQKMHPLPKRSQAHEEGDESVGQAV